MTAKLMYPATKTRAPNNKDCHALSLLTEASGYGSGNTQSLSTKWQFCGIPGGLKKEPARVSDKLIVDS